MKASTKKTVFPNNLGQFLKAFGQGSDGVKYMP